MSSQQDDLCSWRYKRFMDIAAPSAELARQLNKMQVSCNFTGASKRSMAAYYAEQSMMGRPAKLGPVITDAIVETLLTDYGHKSQGAKFAHADHPSRRRRRR